jgi:hypothetical protein
MTGSMDVAIYLLDNGADVDEAVTSAQITPLSMAAGLHEIDILRMLLSRGASLDHFDTYGFDAVTHCIASLIDEQHQAAKVDMLKVITEFGSLDTSLKGRHSHLNLAAMYCGAREIDFLISLGHDVEDHDDWRQGAIYFAASQGNAATYFALRAHGAPTETLEHELLRFLTLWANPVGPRFRRRGIDHYDPIIKDLLSRRVDLMTSICIVGGSPQYIQGPAIPLQQAVAEFGLEIEAWFLGILQECGLETEEDGRWLQALRHRGYHQRGIVIGEVDEESDYDSGDEDPEYAGSESGRSSAGSEADDTEDDECFWDAEEGE